MESVLQLFRNMSPAKIFGVAAGIVVVIAGILFMFYGITTKNFSVLYSNLDLKDSNEIIKELDARGIPYQIKGNGTQIQVPEESLLRLRMEMAEKGLPNKGSLVGYEIFDKSEALGTSNFMQNVNLIRALEGELSRTISSIAQIETARVHLVIPKRELFTREVQKPSASVMVKIRGSNTLTKEQINAMGHMVASAVPGLDMSQVTIIDSKGRALKLAANADEDETSAIIAQSEDYRINYEKRVKRIIEELVEKSVGVGHVNAEVSAEINFDRVVTNSEIYDPEGQVVRSVQSIQENENSNEGTNYNTTVQNNLPNTAETNAAPGSSSNVSRLDETTNYEITKTIKNHISETGTIKRLSIAVIVDGTYDIDEKAGTVKYLPRSEEELKKFESLIKSAVGFDEKRNDKIEVVNMQFAIDLDHLKPKTFKDWFKEEFAGLIQTLVIASVVILVILLVIKPVAMRAFEITRAELDEINNIQNAIDDPSAIKVGQGELKEEIIEIQEADLMHKTSTTKTINELASKYPKETLSIIRRWIQETSQ
ncbi:MAG: flagellar M-ring protein FliF [Sphingobacteriia bacterium]|nr:flagellar M-ring protein FliF [Sphingobacteriia bacterium]